MKKNKQIRVVDCPFCENKGNEFTKSTLKFRPVGYDGKMDFYITCEICGNDIKIPETMIPISWRWAKLRKN